MKKDVIDLKWFQRYKEISDFDDITYLKLNSEELEKEKIAFFSDYTHTPSFNYEIPVELLIEKKKSLVELRKSIVADEKNEWVKNSYSKKLEEQCIKIDMLLATARRDDSSFYESAKKVYGLPNVKDLGIGIGTILNIVRVHDESLDPLIERMAVSLNVTETNGLPDLDMIKPTGFLISAADIKNRFEKALQELGMSWGVVLSDSAQNIFVEYSSESIVIPADRKEYDSVISGLVAHEINTHLRRYKNGLQSGLLLLSTGVAGYLSNEEGLASYQELQVSQAYVPGLALYAGASVAGGVIDGRPGSFSEVFSVIKAVLSIQSACTGRPGLEKVDDEAWKRTVRIYRGIDNIGVGQYFTRDISYWKGYLRIRELIKEGETLTELLKGKF